MPSNPACTKCALHKTSRYICAWGDGPQQAKVMLVGEALGGVEEVKGLPFQGPAGQLLNRILIDAGTSREQVYVTNVNKCRPPANRLPTKEEAYSCLPYLLEEIETVQPEVIVAVGGHAAAFLSAHKGTKPPAIGAQRGKLLQPSRALRTEAKLICTYHPAAVMHRGNDTRMREQIVQDIQLALRLAGGETGREEEKRAYILPEQDGTKQLNALRGASTLAVDLEWTDLSKYKHMGWPWTPGVECYSIALTGHVGGRILSVGLAWPPTPATLAALRDLLLDRPIICHNAMADTMWLEWLGIKHSLFADTLILAFLIDEERRLNLEQLSSLYGAAEPGWKLEGKVERRPYNEDEWRSLLSYNTNDTVATLRLYEIIEKEMQGMGALGQRLRRVHDRLLIRAVPAFTSAARHGVPLDLDALDRLYKQFDTKEKQEVQALVDITGMRPEAVLKMVGSSDAVIGFVRDQFGIDIDSSKADDIEDALETYDFPALKHIVNIRKCSKFKGTYAGPWRELTKRQGDNRLHSIYRLATARTGRSSAEGEKGGTLQTTPRQPVFRRLVKADEGKKIVAADESQMELRVIACLANERRMIQIFNEGGKYGDIHTATAAYVRALEERGLSVEVFWPQRHQWMDRVTKVERQDAKGVNFGFDFGMGEDKFIGYAKKSYNAVFSKAKAHLARTGYFALYPDLLVYHRRQDDLARTVGYVETPFGRRRRVDDFTKAVNTPVQATGSDIPMLALTEIMEEIDALEWTEDQCEFIGFIHDSLMFHVDEELVPILVPIIRQHMEHPDLAQFGIKALPVPLVADIVVGDNWADAKEWKEKETV